MNTVFDKLKEQYKERVIEELENTSLPNYHKKVVGFVEELKYQENIGSITFECAIWLITVKRSSYNALDILTEINNIFK